MKTAILLIITLAARAVMGQDSVDIDGALYYPTNIIATSNMLYEVYWGWSSTYHIAGIEIEHDDTKETLIRRLAAEGHICEVLGHGWQIEHAMTVDHLAESYPLPSQRCRICGKVEVKRETDWE